MLSDVVTASEVEKRGSEQGFVFYMYGSPGAEDDDGDNTTESFQIFYCPFCGQKLPVGVK